VPVKRVALLLASLVFVALAAEGALRLLPPTALGFAFANGRFQVPAEFPFDPRTLPKNRYLFHDVEPGPKRPGETRVMLLGDSYVDSRSVPIPQTVGRRLEHHLDAAGAGRFDVVACGLPGWGQVQQLAFLRRSGAELAPDLVVTLFLSLNDVRNNSEELTRRWRAQVASLVSVRPEVARMPASRAPLFLVEGSRLNQLVSHRLALFLHTRGPDAIPHDYLVYAEDTDAAWEEAWRKTEALLLATREEARKLGAGYALVSATTPQGVLGAQEGLEVLRDAYPAMRGRDFDLDAPDRRLRAFAEAHAIPFLALEPIFREASREGRRLHWRYDQHWNPAGNDLAAREMAEFLLAGLH